MAPVKIDAKSKCILFDAEDDADEKQFIQYLNNNYNGIVDRIELAMQTKSFQQIMVNLLAKGQALKGLKQ